MLSPKQILGRWDQARKYQFSVLDLQAFLNAFDFSYGNFKSFETVAWSNQGLFFPIPFICIWFQDWFYVSKSIVGLEYYYESPNVIRFERIVSDLAIDFVILTIPLLVVMGVARCTQHLRIKVKNIIAYFFKSFASTHEAFLLLRFFFLFYNLLPSSATLWPVHPAIQRFLVFFFHPAPFCSVVFSSASWPIALFFFFFFFSVSTLSSYALFSLDVVCVSIVGFLCSA